MKFIHLSDLHIGKRVNEVSMLDDQAYILDQIIAVIDREQPQAVLIAGDVYDKTLPSAEAVTLLDDFLCRLAKRSVHVIIISGNHDSPERLAFAQRLLAGAGVHISPVYNGVVDPVRLTDEHGDVFFWPLPFIKPVHVRRWFEDEKIESYTDAVRVALEKMGADHSGRNVLLAHQFVTGASTCDSEEISVGGSENVDASVFAGFDYVALGHIHGPQNVGADNIRYCGTPLKYSFSEIRHQKSLTVVELGAKGELDIRTVALVPLRDMRQLKGSYDSLALKSFYEGGDTEDYLHVILTDEEDVPEAVGRLRSIYPNIMKLSYDNARTRANVSVSTTEDLQRKSPMELFEELYEKMNNKAMSDEQRAFTRALIEEIWEGSL